MLKSKKEEKSLSDRTIGIILVGETLVFFAFLITYSMIFLAW